ncbi:DMT family transporter, partial [Micromonospora sediminicola]|uniref:DMT family transporter n=1 Tax=Micromonospora sediminicola TaxID=946078 RepID=UPI00379B55BF
MHRFAEVTIHPLMPALMRSSVLAGMALCAVAQLMLGASIVSTRLLLDYPVFAGQAIRYAIAAVALAAAMLVSVALPGTMRSATNVCLTRGEWGWLAILSAAGLAGYNTCLVVALRHADAATVSTVVGAVPVAVAILAPLIRRHAPSARLLVAAGIVVAGTTLVHGTGHASPLGLAAAVGALLGDVSFALVAAKLLPRIGPVRLSAYSCALAVPLLTAASLAAGEPPSWRLPTLTEWLVLLSLGVALTSVGFWCWFRGIQLATVEHGALTVGLVPLAAITTMTIQDHAMPPVTQVGGICVVVVGLLIGVSARSGFSARNRPRRIVTTARGPAHGDAAGITPLALPRQLSPAYVPDHASHAGVAASPAGTAPQTPQLPPYVSRFDGCRRPVKDPHRRPFTAPLMARVLPVDGQIPPR